MAPSGGFSASESPGIPRDPQVFPWPPVGGFSASKLPGIPIDPRAFLWLEIGGFLGLQVSRYSDRPSSVPMAPSGGFLGLQVTSLLIDPIGIHNIMPGAICILVHFMLFDDCFAPTGNCPSQRETSPPNGKLPSQRETAPPNGGCLRTYKFQPVSYKYFGDLWDL